MILEESHSFTHSRLVKEPHHHSMLHCRSGRYVCLFPAFARSDSSADNQEHSNGTELCKELAEPSRQIHSSGNQSQALLATQAFYMELMAIDLTNPLERLLNDQTTAWHDTVSHLRLYL